MSKEKTIWGNSICAFVIGWMTAYILLGHPMQSFTLERTQGQNWPISIAVLLVVGLAAFFLGRKKELWLHLATVAIIFAASVLTLFLREDGFEALGFALLFGVVVYIFRKDIVSFGDKIVITDSCLKRAYLGLGVLLFLFLSLIGGSRYLAYFSEGHDLGIFSQMYEYMLSTGKQLSTVERDSLLSHFSIHISPIYYSLLPIYWVFRSALTLQICQAALIALSLLPFYFLCRHFKLSNQIILALGICYVCYPALSGGCFNDFHENCFLPVLLFTLIYALETDKTRLFSVCMLAVLFVKEDAAIQCMVLALYFVISGKNKKKGWILAVVSALYLCMALFLLSSGYEGGVLDYMRNMYLTENGGAYDIAKTILMNPGYALRQCLMTPEKIQYLGWMLLPLIAAVSVRQEYSRYLLFLYMIFMNLLPGHGGLSNIYLQYHFPVIVFLFYFVIMNAAEWNSEDRINRMPMMLGITVFLFCVSVFQSGLYVGVEALQERACVQSLNEAIEMIPQDASVRASSRIIPHLTKNKELYGFYVNEETDYIILDYRPDADTEYEYIEEWMDMEHYEEVYFAPDVVKLYQKK